MDITREKELEQELLDKDEIMIAQSRNAAMGEMISMIAHQWRQPISVVAIEASNILVDIELEELNEENLKDIAQNIINQTNELSKTIDDFRNFFKPEKKAQESSLNDIISDALGIIGASLRNNDIEFIVEMEKDIIVETYSRELMQVIVNIIKNAKEVLVDNEIGDKKIIITVEENAEYINIRICDNAGGVNKEIIDKIFDPYFTTKGEKNGTGLGLYMSKTIIEKHLKGSLMVFNNNDGACFEMVVPSTTKETKCSIDL